MSLDRLWAGWRSTYIDGVATQAPVDGPESCLFERLAAADDDAWAYGGTNWNAVYAAVRERLDEVWAPTRFCQARIVK